MLNLRDISDQEAHSTTLDKLELGKKVNMVLQNELLGPLSTIDSMSEIIVKNQLEDKTELIKMATLINNATFFATKKLVCITDLNILLDQKMILPYLDSFNLFEAATRVIEVIQTTNAKDLAIELEVAKNNLWVRSDMDRLQQVLLNLLENVSKEAVADSTIKVKMYTKSMTVE